MVLDRLDECSIRLWPGRDDDGLTSRADEGVVVNGMNIRV